MPHAVSCCGPLLRPLGSLPHLLCSLLDVRLPLLRLFLVVQVIQTLEKLGLAWNIKLPTEKQKARLAFPGGGMHMDTPK